MTMQELQEMETELLKRLEWAKKVHSNTKGLEKELDLVQLAKEAIQYKTSVKRI